MNKAPVSYLQTDPRWKNVDYSAKGESTTIGASGCGPTSMAMVLATWIDPSITPKTECAWALNHGYKYPHQGTAYTYFKTAAARYGLECRQITPSYIYGDASSPYHEEAKKAVDNGNLVIACMGKGLWTSSGHYVLVWRIDGNMIYINDPASTRQARTRGNYAVFKQQVKLYWVIQCPADKKEEPDMTEKETRRIAEEAASKALGKVDTMIREAMKGISAPVVYKDFDDLPEDWGRATVEKLLDKDLLVGTGTGLNITYDMLRILVILDRAGMFDGKNATTEEERERLRKALESAGMD